MAASIMELENARHVPPGAVTLVGISGRAGSGKSMAADLLIAQGYVRLKMADVLKDMLRSLYQSACLPYSEVERRLEGDLKEVPDYLTGGKSPRFLMQTLGGEWGRDTIAPDLWTSVWQIRLSSLLSGSRGVVCDDIRYQNEVAIIHKYGGVVLNITRPGHSVAGGHPSEDGVDGDVEIVNDGTPADLEEKLLSAMCRNTN